MWEEPESLIPNAVLEPVEINGVIVERATLHNFDYIAEKDIRVGDRVLVKRAGEVIPYVIGPVVDVRTGKERKYKPPQVCPVCEQPVEHFEGEVAWYCVNAACPAQLQRNIEHFVSRGSMDIEGLGNELVRILVDYKLVKDVADLFVLTKENLAIINQELTRRRREKKPPKNPAKATKRKEPEKRPGKLLIAIADAKKRPLSRLIVGLGIHGVGEVMANDLSRRFADLDALAKVQAEDLMQIEGIGPSIAESIADWFSQPTNRKVLEKLRKVGVWPQGEKVSVKKTVFEGMTFVVTGTLPSLSRDDAKRFIEENGGKVIDSVSKNTTYLVLGENPGSKLEKAKALSIKTIDEQTLKSLAKGK